MGNNVTVNYDDERFGQVEADKKQAMTELEQTYGGMVKESDKYYQAQIDAQKQWADKQQQLQQEQTDFTIEKIEQQKEQAHKDYLKEQSGSYVDWQKQSNQYGVEAEKQAAAGMAGTGFSESSQVSMFNAYQQRVATAREVMAQAKLAYDNSIKEARLQNNAAMAEIALQTYIKQTELALQGFQYKNSILMEQTNKKLEVDQMFHNRYQDVLKQINTENALAEEIRQYNEKMAFEREQFNYQKQKDAEAKAVAAAKSRSSGGGGGGGSSGSSSASVSKTSDSTKGSSGAKVDTKSIIDLGYGPISADYLASKVASGEVKATQNGNTITFKKSENSGLKAGQALFDKYTWIPKK